MKKRMEEKGIKCRCKFLAIGFVNYFVDYVNWLLMLTFSDCDYICLSNLLKWHWSNKCCNNNNISTEILQVGLGRVKCMQILSLSGKR